MNNGKENLKQSSFKDFVSNSDVKTLCLDLVVSSAIPFSIFDTLALKTLVLHAAAHLSENIVVNSHSKIVFTDKRRRINKTLLESILLLRLYKKNSMS